MSDGEKSHGRILYLNGTSSSGKSTLARALMDLSDEAYTHLALDYIWSDLHSYAAKLSRSGNHVIVDNVAALFGARNCSSFDDGFELLSDLPVILVKVDCSLDELERRERERGDRMIGLARIQIESVHAHGEYDLVVDTSKNSMLECAGQISEFLKSGSPVGAYDRLRQAYEAAVDRLHDLVRTYHRAHTGKDADLAASCLAETFVNVTAGRYADPESWGAGTFQTREETCLSLADEFATDSRKYQCEIEFLRTDIQSSNAALVTRETGGLVRPDGKMASSWEDVENIYYLTQRNDEWCIVGSLHGIG